MSLPDIDYYLHKQILPPVERLCAPISGTNITQLADCLGLDTTKYRVSTVQNNNGQEAEIQPLESQIPDSVRFKESAPLQLRCRKCKHAFEFRGIAPSQDAAGAAVVSHDGIACPVEGCGTPLPNLSVVAQLETQIRQHIARYYAGWLVCDDPACGNRSRQMSVYGHRCLGPKGLGSGCLGRMHFEYTEKAMYNQLLYLSSLFDVDKARDRITKENGIENVDKIKVLVECNRERFGTAKGVLSEYLRTNGRQWVQMDSIFGFVLKTMAH
jgi:DNA polymerase alpha subunit A